MSPAKPDLTVRLCAKVKGSGMERARALGRWARVREGFITFLCSLTTEDSVLSLSSPIDCLMVYWGGGALPPHTTPKLRPLASVPLTIKSQVCCYLPLPPSFIIRVAVITSIEIAHLDNNCSSSIIQVPLWQHCSGANDHWHTVNFNHLMF